MNRQTIKQDDYEMKNDNSYVVWSNIMKRDSHKLCSTPNQFKDNVENGQTEL